MWLLHPIYSACVGACIAIPLHHHDLIASYTQTQALRVDHIQRELDDQNYLAAIKAIMALLKSLCTLVVAILVILSTGDSLGAAAARPVRIYGARTEALLGERTGRRLAVSPWATTRRDADKLRVTKGEAAPSRRSNNPNTPGKKQP